MTVTVSDVMRRVRNFFPVASTEGPWQLRQGMLTPTLHAPGDWIAIEGEGPAGVYRLDEHGAICGVSDCEWTGRVWLLRPPADFLRLCAQIAQWQEAHPDPTVLSERFGEYSRSQTGAAWEKVFAAALRPYLRMYPEVRLSC